MALTKWDGGMAAGMTAHSQAERKRLAIVKAKTRAINHYADPVLEGGGAERDKEQMEKKWIGLRREIYMSTACSQL